MYLSAAEGPVLKNHVAEVTGLRQLLNGIEMTYALDEHWSLFSNESVPYSSLPRNVMALTKNTRIKYIRM